MESFVDVLEQVKLRVLDNMSEQAFDLWIKDIAPVGMDAQMVRLSVKSQFKKDIINDKYLKLLEQSFEAVLGFAVKVQILCEEPPRTPPPEEVNPFFPYSKEEIEKNSQGGDYEYTFATFIVGSSNKFAHAACHAVAQNPASAYNPLFIHGGSGLGKTHLLCAIAAEIRTNKPDTNIVYVKGEAFTNELIEAISTESTAKFHDKYRQADILLVDDIQFIGGKESTQEEFFHTFNTLYESGKQIVLTSDRPPKEIKTLEDRLRTRFEWGLIADIQPPDFETRIAIIKRKAELMDIHIPPEVAEYIANRIKNNIRQLEGVVKKLKAFQLLAQTPPSIAVAQNAIRDILSDNQPIPVTVERIISEVGRTYGVSSADIRSSKRSAPISSARQAAAYIVREITQMSTTGIGEELGGRDHSTIVYNIEQAEKKMGKDPRYKATIEDIIKNIRDS